MPILNYYLRLTSPTGKRITLFTDNGLFTTNPWKEIRANNGTWRYRKGTDIPWEIEKDRGPAWEPISDLDVEYWTNYINLLENTAKNVPTLNGLQYTRKWITGKLDKEKQGGRLMRVGGKIIEVPKYQAGTIQDGILYHDLSRTPESFRTDFASGNFQGNTEEEKKQAADRYKKQGTFAEALRYWKELGFYDVLPEGDLTKVANRRAWAKNNGFENYNPTRWQDNVKLWKILEAHFASVELPEKGQATYKRLNGIK